MKKLWRSSTTDVSSSNGWSGTTSVTSKMSLKSYAPTTSTHSNSWIGSSARRWSNHLQELPRNESNWSHRPIPGTVRSDPCNKLQRHSLGRTRIIGPCFSWPLQGKEESLRNEQVVGRSDRCTLVPHTPFQGNGRDLRMRLVYGQHRCRSAACPNHLFADSRV